jgi:MarR family transcriptional regulator, negative regulator of the multidrug operon emrRAB
MGSRETERARTGNLLGAVALGIGDRLEAEAQLAAGRRGARAAALATLAQWPGYTIEGLRHCLGLSHSATVRLIDGLVEDGLVVRERVGGGPAVRPRLTDAGEAAAREVLAARSQAVQSLTELLSDEDLSRLAPILERLLASMTTDFSAGELICRLCELDDCPQDMCPVELMQRQHRATGRQGDAGQRSGAGVEPTQRRVTPPHRF